MIINGFHLINVHIKPYLNMVNLAGHRKVLQSIIYLKLKTHPNISVSINFRYANKPEKPLDIHTSYCLKIQLLCRNQF